MKKGSILPLVLGLVVALTVVGLAIEKLSKNDRSGLKEESISDSRVEQVYRSDALGVEFEHSFDVIEERKDSVLLGDSSTFYLSILKDSILKGSPEDYKRCSEVWRQESDEYPCLQDGKDWGQEKDMEQIILAGKPATSFYIAEGVSHADYHVVMTEAPPLAFKMYISGGGLDDNFMKILSTLKFLD